MRKLMGVLALMFVVSTVAPAAAVATAAPGQRVAGHRIEVAATFHGGGSLQTACKVFSNTGDGRFRDADLGSGRYHYLVCVDFFAHPVTFTGYLSLTTARGAMTGTITGTYIPGDGLIFPIAITGGTGRFAHAHGSLTMGPIRQRGQTDCDPRAPSCLDWKEAGPITGTITHVS